MGMLDGKVCLITGTSRGIGAKTVERFAEEGAVVYANARTVGCIDASCDDLSARNNTTVKPLYFDVRDESASKKMVLQIKREQGRIDVLVNNAGIMKDALIGMIPRSLMQEIYETNVFGVMNMMQLVTKVMMFQKSGSIINLSSIVGIEGNAGQLVYSATKGAVVAMTKTASKELAEKGIRVNAVAPGMIDTDMFRSIGEEKINEHLSHIRMGRLGSAEEVADVILFLASDLSRYVTGEIVGVDGGAMV